MTDKKHKPLSPAMSGDKSATGGNNPQGIGVLKKYLKQSTIYTIQKSCLAHMALVGHVSAAKCVK
jgi:hypothetical protein